MLVACAPYNLQLFISSASNKQTRSTFVVRPAPQHLWVTGAPQPEWHLPRRALAAASASGMRSGLVTTPHPINKC